MNETLFKNREETHSTKKSWTVPDFLMGCQCPLAKVSLLCVKPFLSSTQDFLGE